MALIVEAFDAIKAAAESGVRAEVEQMATRLIDTWIARAEKLGFASAKNQLRAALDDLESRIWVLEDKYRNDASEMIGAGRHEEAKAALKIADALTAFTNSKRSAFVQLSHLT